MWPFDEEDEDDKKDPSSLPMKPTNPQVGPPMPDDMMNQRVKDYVTKKYNIASDDSEVKKAQAQADRNNNIANFAQALEAIFRAEGQAHGGQGVNTGLYNAMRSQGSDKVKAAREARKEAMDSVLAENQLGRQFDADDRAQKEFSSKQSELNADSDPNSPRSKAAREFYKKNFSNLGLDRIEGFETLSASDIRSSLTDPVKLKKTLDDRAADRALDAKKIAMSPYGGLKPTEAQKAVDRQFGKDYAEYVVGGGYADSQRQIEQLRKAQEKLGKTDSATGPIVGALPDFVRKRVTPEGFAIQENVEEVVQRNLRQVLGPQFTQAEGERLISRAYNPSLSEAENKRRLELLGRQMEQAAEAKQAAAEYFQQYGTLQGFQGKLYNPGDFLTEDDLKAPKEPKEEAPKKPTPTKTKPKTIIQNGYTYTLNEETGEYE